MITLDTLDKTKTYILGVSGGPDSMALFDMCLQAGIQVVAAHMNYQIRESAYRDMKLVEDYAYLHHVPCVIRLQEKSWKGNFEAFAREARYQLYRELVVKYQAAGVLLAHHMDDHIETYLMQKERASEGDVWGICDHTQVMGCEIYRPLLMLCKEDLLAYCDEHQVPYGIDETNLTQVYTRNRIRLQVVDHMTLEEKKDLVKQIELENQQKLNQQTRWNQFFKEWNGEVSTLLTLGQDINVALFYYVKNTTQIALSHQEISQLTTLLNKQRNGWKRTIANEYEIYQEYGKLCIDPMKQIQYHYQYDAPCFEETPFFKITKQGASTEALTLQEDDYPICIRSYQPGDAIQLRFGKKKLNRWFIDRKIPKKERETWPVVTNRHGNVILVPKIGCDIEHFSNNPTLFVVK